MLQDREEFFGNKTDTEMMVQPKGADWPFESLSSRVGQVMSRGLAIVP